MKMGYVQFAPALGDMEATLSAIEDLRHEFAAADLVVFPELCNSGYNFESPEQARDTAEDARDGRFVRFLQSLCRDHNQHIVAGINERDAESGRLFNSAVLVGPEGMVGKYRKLHLFMNEKDLFEPGDVGLPVVDLGAWRVGLLICFDWVFPEAWRVLALRGADIVCHPSALVIPGLAQRAVPVQALMNRFYIITANRIGREGDLSFTGLSTIADPRGEVLAQGSPGQVEVSIVDVDVASARDKMITPRNSVLGDRRPEEYTDLVRSRGAS